MNNTHKIFVSIIVMLIIVGCSTKKDAFLNRNFHAVNTKYNILFNGHEALRIGLEQLNANYEDNFWERLPIEPLKVDKLAMPGLASDIDSSPKEFERAEEKAVKAIQKHSMLIARQERNKQIDDAYLLLGKSRYYSKRFVPALEAFTYVINNYPRANLINETKIWHAKTQIRLRNEEQAIINLKRLLKDDSLKQKIFEDAHTALAMAYMSLDSLDNALYHLNKGVLITNKNKVIAKAMITKNKKNVIKPVLSTKNEEQIARNLYIIGQIYKEKGLIDSSNIAFTNIIKFNKAPRKYSVRAQIEKAKNFISKEDASSAIAALQKITKNSYNKPYLDEIYYQLGVIENANNSEEAIWYFKKSLEASAMPNFQKELSYEAAGNYYFDKAKFAVAGAYYDSILGITLSESSKRIRSLARKRSNLNDVILYENIAKVNDSILTISAMTLDEQTAFFTSYIEKLKAEDEKQQKVSSTGSGFFNSLGLGNKEDESTGKWYFYNTQTLSFGEQEFRRIWGNRPLEENWRLSDKTQLNFQGNNSNQLHDITKIDASKKYELNYYLERIPSEVSKIDSLKQERNNAYYKLGVIYKEQFNEFDLAIDKLESVLLFNPDQKIEIPAKYHLYKMYEVQNNSRATILKEDITSNYPETIYAKIILDPNSVLQDKGSSPESEYALVFYDYKDNKFDAVLEQANLAITKYEGHEIVPKFELLKAYTIGKTAGIKAFEIALNVVATNYPNTEEGKKALEVLKTIKSKI
ncbi:MULTISPECIES: type IX secretion system periplasmic lipoprotein PorW/SprE [Flavobacteriaceae]|uniref:Tetratricopeptide repeat protein n=2 Tax=Flavobacteriaceae TaxID=49546 RepID=A0A4Y8AR75_9FLAO|nr:MULTISPECIES: tetratricopeptide repeat protein [Flavobacteriaceae]TEW73710.1 tetratricopeptide repeat protein [Gramella jeungdoensis]